MSAWSNGFIDDVVEKRVWAGSIPFRIGRVPYRHSSFPVSALPYLSLIHPRKQVSPTSPSFTCLCTFNRIQFLGHCHITFINVLFLLSYQASYLHILYFEQSFRPSFICIWSLANVICLQNPDGDRPQHQPTSINININIISIDKLLMFFLDTLLLTTHWETVPIWSPMSKVCFLQSLTNRYIFNTWSSQESR